ncbi:MAG: hypothetical protein IPH20_12850 [Bacteroidales bacterium]|nr:hypothetical protein [Bacteroidales bacterium]
MENRSQVFYKSHGVSFTGKLYSFCLIDVHRFRLRQKHRVRLIRPEYCGKKFLQTGLPPDKWCDFTRQ